MPGTLYRTGAGAGLVHTVESVDESGREVEVTVEIPAEEAAHRSATRLAGPERAQAGADPGRRP